MRVAAMKLELYAPWSQSLKDKRREVKSLTQRLRNRFHVSAAEVEAQDERQHIVLGVAAVTASDTAAQEMFESILRFVEENSEAQLVSAEREVY